ncbi:MAG: hypothetical protein WA584_03940 [Pyrinomonadaceae bacterium]
MKYFGLILICVVVYAVSYTLANFKEDNQLKKETVLADYSDTVHISFTNLNPNEILHQVAQKYKNFRYYTSNGRTEFTMNTSGRIKKEYADLVIKLITPTQMKLKWTENDKEKEFTINENQVFMTNDNGTREDFDERGWGLSLATGEYGKSKFLITRGLFAATSDMKSEIDIMENPQTIGLDNFESFDCYVIEGNLPRNLGKTTLWIDKEESLIRKIKRHLALSNNSSFEIQETYFDIETK